MKKLFFSVFILAFSANLWAQQIAPEDLKQLKIKEDSLKTLAPSILQAETMEERAYADSLFTRILVRALAVKNSFYYPFDSIQTISKLVPSDKNFKIFSWHLILDEDLVRQRGAIQMNTKDGALKLFPLVDKSEQMENAADMITDNTEWYGAIYYKIIEKKSGGNTFYTLLGYDENNAQSTIKLIEILTFKNGKPVFGSKNFSFPGTVAPSGLARYIMEFKKGASPSLNFDTDLDRIVLEHLIAENGEVEKKYTYIPDGDYDALKWSGGKWVYEYKIFREITPEGKPPMPVPLLDPKGKIDESKLGKKFPPGNDNPDRE